MSSDTAKPDGCGCCAGLEVPAPVHNDPGLPALDYRIDSQPGFYARMLQSMPLRRSDPDKADAPRPLARLLTRASDDPTVALVDAAACVAHVLGFYQERIANEGFLRTAIERRSVLELARAIGYELKPGVAASVHLAFTVEDAQGAPGICTLAKGTPVQSVPPQGKLPQVFETSADIVARAEWNALRPRQTRPADMAVLIDGTGTPTALALLGPGGSFPPETTGLHTDLNSGDLYRLDPDIPVDGKVDALEVGHVFFSEAASGIEGGDLLLFVGKKGTELKTLVLRATAAKAEPELKRIRVDVEALPDPVSHAQPDTAAWVVPYQFKPLMSYAKPRIESVGFTKSTISTMITSKLWKESDLQAMIGIQRWHGANLVKAIAASKQDESGVPPNTGAFSFGARLRFFGHNAPKWASLPKGTYTNGTAYAMGWDKDDPIGAGGTPPNLPQARKVWEDSQGVPYDSAHAYLERKVPNVNRGSWVVFDSSSVQAKSYPVFDARTASQADFGLSGDAMELRLADDAGNLLTSAPSDSSNNFTFRDTTAHVASNRLDLAELPIDAPVPVKPSDKTIELDRMVLGLSIGQAVALVGERYDLPGVNAAEIALLADIEHANGRTILTLENKLGYSYVRSSLTISANVVHATHGETTEEVLGNGDAATPNQRFTLKKPPTTFLSATGGVRSTLEVRIAGVLWDELPSLFGAGPDRPVYMTRIDNDANMELTFGDGVQGARLPTGTLNVSARYRSGIDPDGEVDAGTLTMLRAMPLGLRGVTNPVAASGAEGPEQLDAARRNAPLTLLTFERVVSLLDYENYACAFPGIGKARAELLWVDGAQRVFLTLAGATGGAPGDDILENLIDSIAAASDPAQRFDAGAFEQRYFSLKATVVIDPRHVIETVLAAVRTSLITGYGFEQRALGQSVSAAEVIALIHRTPGVVAVDLDELLPYGDPSSFAVPDATAIPAFGARWIDSTRTALPAELLLINPAGIELEGIQT